MCGNFEPGEHKFNILDTVDVKKSTRGFFTQGANVLVVGVLGEILLTRLFIEEEIVHIFVTRVRTQIQ